MAADFLDVSDRVAAAAAAGQAIVALESTILAHGMPYPANLELARDVESIVRAHGATPATIAVLNGRLKVGLSAAELETIATASGIIKASVRDLPYLLAQKLNGATTVAATMRIASLAGIGVFATGGIGGVHRGAGRNFDISADLQEFAVSQVAVVSAGAKAILDLPATLEYLETLGVPVIGFGTSDFPAFYSRSSGLPVPHRVNSVADLARIVRTQRAIGMRGGILIANPIPERDELPAASIDRHIKAALAEAEIAAVAGKELTPYLLKRILELSGGHSQAANMALVRNNAELAARLAQELCSIGR